MNRKVLLAIVLVLTLTTAAIHFSLGGGMMARGLGGPGQPGFGGNGQPPAGGQIPDGSQFQGNGPGRAGGLFAVMRFLPFLFILNGLGYVFLLALVALPIPYFREHPSLTHWLLIGFAAVTFIAYFLINGVAMFLGNPMAIIAKAAEALLIIFIFLHLRAVQAQKSGPSTGSLPTASAEADGGA